MIFGLRVINCAFGPKPCFLCCLHHTRESTTTRLSYSIILTIVVVLSTASHEGGLMGMVYGRYKQEIDRFCNYVHAGDNCSRFAGFIGIYRLCLPLFFFHFVMSIFTIGVSSSQTIRGKIHNGFWAWKVIILLGLYISAYSFPSLESHVKVWMIFGIVGGLVFIYVQHITLIDFAYEVNGIWHAKAAKSICYTLCIYTCTLVLYLATMIAYTVFVLLYGLPHQCTLNLTVTGINAGLTALFAICSAFSNTLQRKQLWLPGAVTSAFVAFLTWTALSSQPKTLSSDVPWQNKAVSDMEKGRNVSIHPMLVVADQLNRLLSDQFATENTRNRPSSGTVASTTPTIMVNLCLPGGIGSLSEHLGKDLSTFVGLVVVIGGSLYSSFRTTMQARRLGIRTRREKLKRLLFPIEERPEPADTGANISNSQLDLNEPPSPRYLSRKEVRRQERALNMLAAAVADLPNPKVFRRPSTRQPESQVVCNSPSQMVPKAALNKNRLAAQPKPLSDNNTTIQSTLRVSSSVPDLSVAFRQSSENPRRRRDIRDLNWDEAVDQMQRSAGLSGHQSDHDTDKSKNLSVRKLRRRSKLPVGGDSVTITNTPGVDMDEQFGDVLQQLHLKQTRIPKKRQDTKRVPLKPVKRTPLSRITDEDTFAEWTMLSPDTLPEKVGAHSPLSNGRLSFGNGHLIFPSRRSSTSSAGAKLSSPVLPDSDPYDLVSMRSPKHLRYQLARSASDLMLSKRGSKILVSQPKLASSFAFLGPMLNTAAPRDKYTVYNETIASVYSYSWFHFIYGLATLYLMAQLTNWYNPQISRVETLSGSWANMWMKLASSWIALILYAWTIACPRFCFGRKLGDTPFTPRTPRSGSTNSSPV